MGRSWRLGSAFGIGVYVHWTFLLLLGWVLVMNFGGGGGLAGAGYLVVLLGAVFGCVLLHELGHALAARRFGIATRDITLSPIGGIARLERMSERPWEEFVIAVAGPTVNVVLAVLLALAVGGVGMGQAVLPSGWGPYLGWGGSLLGHLLAANVMLVVFNLIPAFPMDGGRVLRALLAARLGRLRATELAVRVGMFAAVAMVAVGLTGWPISAPMMPLIAVFVWFAGRQELVALRRREAELPWALPVEAVPTDDVQETSYLHANGWRLQVLWRNGRPIAMSWDRPE